MLKILTHPNPLLRKKSLPVQKDEFLNSEFQQFIDQLEKLMLQEEGAGLAAPQVGTHKRLVAINLDKQVKEFVNPKIVRKSFRKNILEEGCLSVPKVFGKVKRARRIKIKYQDRQAIWHKLKCGDYLSRVLQHEIDHLNGILFIDKMI